MVVEELAIATRTRRHCHLLSLAGRATLHEGRPGIRSTLGNQRREEEPGSGRGDRQHLATKTIAANAERLTLTPYLNGREAASARLNMKLLRGLKLGSEHRKLALL
jgi:hypothetical protein